MDVTIRTEVVRRCPLDGTAPIVAESLKISLVLPITYPEPCNVQLHMDGTQNSLVVYTGHVNTTA